MFHKLLKYPLFISDYNLTCIFSTDFSKNHHIICFIKILPLGTQFIHSGRQADMAKLIVAFGNFAETHERLSYRIPAPRILLKLSVSMCRVIAQNLSHSTATVMLPLGGNLLIPREHNAASTLLLQAHQFPSAINYTDVFKFLRCASDPSSQHVINTLIIIMLMFGVWFVERLVSYF